MMKLKLKEQLSTDWKEYVCDLTHKLDVHFQNDNSHKHYILVTTEYAKLKCYPIRSSEGTLGGLFVDDNDVIIKINIPLEKEDKKLTSMIQEFIGQEMVI